MSIYTPELVNMINDAQIHLSFAAMSWNKGLIDQLNKKELLDIIYDSILFRTIISVIGWCDMQSTDTLPDYYYKIGDAEALYVYSESCYYIASMLEDHDSIESLEHSLSRTIKGWENIMLAQLDRRRGN